ncbi:MAG: HAMP domain-containing histidine kinase, partial [Acidimicrobiia bacterium]|nr:HAMP domain-containing histidine kinase [Acidimicrobiia bacterium]
MGGSRRRLGLRARYTVAAAVGALAVTSLVSVITYFLVRNFLLAQRDAVAQRQAFTNARVVRDVLRSTDPNSSAPEIADLLSTLRSETGSFSFVWFRDQWYGTSVGLSDDELPNDLRRAVIDGETGRQRFTTLGGSPNVAVAVAIPAAEAAYVEVFPLTGLSGTLTAVRNSLLVASLVTTLGGAGLGYWSSRRILRPVTEMADAAEAIAKGGLDTRLGRERDPDLHRLVTSFNEMADAVQARIEREARFASDVSHELRTPLATLTGATELLESRRDDLPDRSRQALDIVVTQLSRFSALVLDLLEISRIDAGVADVHLEAVQVPELVSRIASATGHEETRLEVAAPVADAVVVLDKRRFERAVANLLENADRHG